MAIRVKTAIVRCFPQLDLRPNGSRSVLCRNYPVELHTAVVFCRYSFKFVCPHELIFVWNNPPTACYESRFCVTSSPVLFDEFDVCVSVQAK